MDSLAKKNEQRAYGLLDPNYRFLTGLVLRRKDMVSDCDGLCNDIPDSFDIAMLASGKNIYIDNLQRHLTELEQMSLLGICLIDNLLDMFPEDLTNVDQDFFSKVLGEYDLIVCCDAAVKQEKQEKAQQAQYEKDITQRSESFKKIMLETFQAVMSHEGAKRYRNFNKSRRDGTRKTQTITRAITEIVQRFYTEHQRKPTLKNVLRVLKEEKYCGKGKLITVEDDIDYDKKKLFYRGNSGEEKEVSFRTITNHIGKIYKEIITIENHTTSHTV